MANTIAVAPNGGYFAQLDGPPYSVTVYDLNGGAHGQYTAPAGQPLSMLWLPDSSGLALWKGGAASTSSGPLGIMSVDGTIHQTALTPFCPSISPDSQWIADTPAFGPGAGDVQVVARDGTTPRTLVPGTALGWLAGRVVYATESGLYAIALDGRDNRRLGDNVGLAICQQESAPFQLLSPDGQVLLAYGSRGTLWAITLNGLMRNGYPELDQVSNFWAGAHTAYGQYSASIQYVDMATGIGGPSTSAYPQGLYIQAFAGIWVAAVSNDSARMLHLLNLKTGEGTEVSALSGPLLVYPLGTSRFLVKYNGTPARLYVVDPTLIGGFAPTGPPVG
jgi:hypothetical protein